MTAGALVVLCIIALALVCFIWQLLPLELTAMVVMALLLLFNLVSPEEAVAGFSNPATITVASMFVLSGALKKSGSLNGLKRWMQGLSGRPALFLIALMLVVGLTSAFVNNTGVVALFLPIVIALAHERGLAPSKLLIPISYAAQAGGVCTLIGTSTNLLASSIYVEAGYGPFSLFEMSRLGIVLLLALVLVFALFGRWLLPQRPSPPLLEAYQLNEYFTEVRVLASSPLIGRSLKVSDFSEMSGVAVVQLLRDNKAMAEWFYEKVQEGDILLVEGKLDDILALKATYMLEVEPEFRLSEELLGGEELSLVEVMIAPGAQIKRHTLKSWLFKYRHNVIVLAIRRKERTFHDKLSQIKLLEGDLLLLQGRKEDIVAISDDENFIVLQDVPAEAFDKGRALRAVAIVGAVVLTAAFNVFPIMVSAIMGCIMALLTGCIRLRDAYRSIDWSVIILLAGMLPLSIALTRSGLAQTLGAQLSMHNEAMSPVVALAGLYVTSALLTEVMTNNAAVAVLVPVAISTAGAFGVDAKPFVMAVTFAASTSFLTPVGYQTNAMIFTAGGYRYGDFMRAGLPVNIIFLIISVFLIPLLWPFRP